MGRNEAGKTVVTGPAGYFLAVLDLLGPSIPQLSSVIPRVGDTLDAPKYSNFNCLTACEEQRAMSVPPRKSG